MENQTTQMVDMIYNLLDKDHPMVHMEMEYGNQQMLEKLGSLRDSKIHDVYHVFVFIQKIQILFTLQH